MDDEVKVGRAQYVERTNNQSSVGLDVDHLYE